MFPQVALSIKESEGGKEGMELEDNFQDITSPQNKEDQITADPKNLQKKLDELKDVMSEECFKYAQRLVNKPPPDPDLLQFLIHLHKDLHHKSNKGPNNSERSESGYKATVKVFLVVTGQTFGADQVILEQVKNLGWSSTWKVEITNNRQECDVIIVFCPITSRVGSDVEAAMREDSVSCGGKPVILVLMHHTRDPDYSTDVRRWFETFQNVVLDVDVLFHQTQPGLLRCSRNDRAVRLIQEELKKH
ncbi:uncharacterized protein LOC120570159 isoform X2 [Perca fluviatilis]|uniref:uncharacterized protein LOC120570159 isoform X2 n=1 Tax=Perca fluviatilis TaxID=8168 RepID=UPI001962BDFF|nr:uncharacterized protein LOC120570159 isoform X2 [Perca fluviatilis]